MIGKGFGTILIGVTARWLGTFLAAFEKKYTVRERAFMAFAWIPKATVQAALGGIMLMRAQAEGLTDQYQEWGQAMLTTAVFSICLTAPLGAIFINTLGTKWLNYDGDVEMNEDDDEEQGETKKPGKNGREGSELVVEDVDESGPATGRAKANQDATGGNAEPQNEGATAIKTDKVNEVN